MNSIIGTQFLLEKIFGKTEETNANALVLW